MISRISTSGRHPGPKMNLRRDLQRVEQGDSRPPSSDRPSTYQYFVDGVVVARERGNKLTGVKLLRKRPARNKRWYCWHQFNRSKNASNSSAKPRRWQENEAAAPALAPAQNDVWRVHRPGKNVSSPVGSWCPAALIVKTEKHQG